MQLHITQYKHPKGGAAVIMSNFNNPKMQLEDLKRSPDLLNNVKIGHGQLRLIIQTYYGHGGHFGQVSYLYLLNTPYEI